MVPRASRIRSDRVIIHRSDDRQALMIRTVRGVRLTGVEATAGREYRFDFTFRGHRVILETNGRRWHDDPADYEHDNDKWSVPGRLGFRIVFATWNKVTRAPEDLIREVRATLAQ